MFQTRLIELLGIEHPILQAPIGAASCPQLASAVSNAGGLGCLAASSWSVEDLRIDIRRTRDLSNKPFAVNILLAFPAEDYFNECLRSDVRVVSFAWGDPTPYIGAAHAAGALVLAAAASPTEALRYARAGVDGVVAQGFEAGGHVAGAASTMALVPRIVDAVSPIPVIAAGGIGDGRGLAAALALGAAGISMGTRFLATTESNAHPLYKQALLQADVTDTVHGYTFDGGWHAPHRTLRNSTTTAWENAGCPSAGSRPNEGHRIGTSGRGTPVLQYDDVIPHAQSTGDVEQFALYAGESVGLVNDVCSAAEVVRRTMLEAEQSLGRLRP